MNLDKYYLVKIAIHGDYIIAFIKKNNKENNFLGLAISKKIRKSLSKKQDKKAA